MSIRTFPSLKNFIGSSAVNAKGPQTNTNTSTSASRGSYRSQQQQSERYRSVSNTVVGSARNFDATRRVHIVSLKLASENYSS